MCPPGVDQTERSPQRFYILAPKLQKCIRNLQYLDRFYLFDLLQSRSLLRSSSGDSVAISRAHAQNAVTHSPLERLPSELLGLIFSDEGLECRDMLALGLSSAFLWQHFLRNCAKRSDVGVLSGTPLFSIGNYLRRFPTRVPELFPEVNDLKSRLAEAGSRRLPAREWLVGVVSWGGRILEDGVVHSWKNTLDSIKNHGLGVATLQRLESDLRHVAQEQGIGEPGQKWFLRNLRAKEYVRLEASLEPDESARDISEFAGQGANSRALVATVVSAPWLSLDTGLFFMTLFPKPDREHDQIPGEAEWAGHEFDIVSEKQWQSLDHGEWADATDKMRVASRKLRSSVFGEYYYDEDDDDGDDDG
ncbi:hypothetical protein LMH87_011565 [Akanthomyces muscarius]|uniref:Uncharacterized protein n=1 Tax=Akanthomyces muscarius TaxID=2231603 RepID=A0A9W8QA73_AKAMU|nr:hypothetical protein LMH87_011565 [Akanthomyces muscarius]KAJ4150834.1 hypothetical protein LMH87_011565 [Akanthomyces muscarius]